MVKLGLEGWVQTEEFDLSYSTHLPLPCLFTKTYKSLRTTSRKSTVASQLLLSVIGEVLEPLFCLDPGTWHAVMTPYM